MHIKGAHVRKLIARFGDIIAGAGWFAGLWGLCTNSLNARIDVR